MTDLLIPPEQIAQMTGYKRASDQVRALRNMGFFRARVNRAGLVVLERAHYDAVCVTSAPTRHKDTEPQLRLA
jgi:hypothetical protein